MGSGVFAYAVILPKRTNLVKQAHSGAPQAHPPTPNAPNLDNPQTGAPQTNSHENPKRRHLNAPDRTQAHLRRIRRSQAETQWTTAPPYASPKGRRTGASSSLIANCYTPNHGKKTRILRPMATHPSTNPRQRQPHLPNPTNRLHHPRHPSRPHHTHQPRRSLVGPHQPQSLMPTLQQPTHRPDKTKPMANQRTTHHTHPRTQRPPQPPTHTRPRTNRRPHHRPHHPREHTERRS